MNNIKKLYGLLFCLLIVILISYTFASTIDTVNAIEEEKIEELKEEPITYQIYFNPSLEMGKLEKSERKKVVKNACNIEFVGNCKIYFY